MFKTLRLLSFLKDLVVLLLNCRNIVHIPQFLRWNCYSMGSLVVSTLECDARMPRLKPWLHHNNFPKFLYFFSCFDTFHFKHIYFSFNLFSFLKLTKKNNTKYKTISIVECEAFGVKCSEHFFEQELNLKGIGIFMSNITVITLNNTGEGLLPTRISS